MASAVRLGPRLKELRLHLCQKSPSSKGVREFIESHYVPIKKENPKFPILIRECSGIVPRIWARYEFGAERSVSLTDQSKESVLKVVKELQSAK